MLIQELTLHGLLSFGPDSPSLKMGPLNVLIGPNGSGKSNLIEVIGLLRSAATKLSAPIKRSGVGAAEWVWKGAPENRMFIKAEVNCLEYDQALSHMIRLELLQGVRCEVAGEQIERVRPVLQSDQKILYVFDGSGASLSRRDGANQHIEAGALARDESILSQRKDPEQYAELAQLAEAYAGIRLYREWSFGRSSVLRGRQAADLPSRLLEEDFSNLGLFLLRLRGIPYIKKAIIERLRDLYNGLDDFDAGVVGGTVEVRLTEGDFGIPAGRLSDGTLRYLCLLAILCDPDPPPLICIEEPELGLHPDMLPKLADLLVEASSRTQLVVTTHSDILVDAMTEHPESVVVFEKRDGQTHMNRLDRNELKEWLEQYRLGQLWTRGQIGGTRW